MAKTESDRKNKIDTGKLQVTPLGNDKKKTKKADDKPHEEFIDPSSNKSKTNKPIKKA
ncbi:hypothetical protein [Lunatibacter salilacus]|uniref:hypothetical protein n=1 Tax=Lunatibacter salilacus TaxID=2483804 RepID=UPI00131DB1ED|nr:hypothetical protein [Lunatibacter salilacus]